MRAPLERVKRATNKAAIAFLNGSIKEEAEEEEEEKGKKRGGKRDFFGMIRERELGLLMRRRAWRHHNIMPFGFGG